MRSASEIDFTRWRRHRRTRTHTPHAHSSRPRSLRPSRGPFSAMALCPEARVPFTEACSGVGVCLDSLSCECPQGLSGVSDWAIGAPTCAISPVAIQVMYSILAVAQFAQLTFTLYFLKRLWQTSSSQNAKKKRRDRYKVVMAIFSVLSTLFFIPLAIIRASQPVNPTSTIGTSTVTTILFAFGISTFWIYALLFSQSILALSLDQLRMQTQEARDNLATAIAILQKGFPIVLVCVVFFCIIPVFLLASTHPWTWYARKYCPACFAANQLTEILSYSNFCAL